MSQASLCFWAKLGPNDDDNRYEDWLVSVARSGALFSIIYLDFTVL